MESDIDAAATEISSSRLNDLFKEYDQVLPGLRLFVEIFRGAPAIDSLGSVLERIRRALEDHPHGTAGAADFVLFGEAGSVFSILQSVGFLGVKDESSGRFVFCHDGADTELDLQNRDALVAIHSCYWRALGIVVDELVDGIIDIHDEYRVDARSGLTDLRTARFGQIVGQLPTIPAGVDGRREFEQWTSTTLSVLLEAETSKPRLTEAQSDTDARLFIASIRQKNESRLWSRIVKDYGTTLLLGLIINAPTLLPEHVHLAGATSMPGAGRFRLLVSRDERKLSDETKDAFHDVLKQNDIVVLHMSAESLARSFHKQRAARRKAYTDKQFTKALDLTLQSCARPRRLPPRSGRQ